MTTTIVIMRVNIQKDILVVFNYRLDFSNHLDMIIANS